MIGTIAPGFAGCVEFGCKSKGHKSDEVIGEIVEVFVA